MLVREVLSRNAAGIVGAGRTELVRGIAGVEIVLLRRLLGLPGVLHAEVVDAAEDRQERLLDPREVGERQDQARRQIGTGLMPDRCRQRIDVDSKHAVTADFVAALSPRKRREEWLTPFRQRCCLPV